MKKEPISPNTGSFIFREFDEKIGFFKTGAKQLELADTRLFFTYSDENMLCQKVYIIIVGYWKDDATPFWFNFTGDYTYF